MTVKEYGDRMIEIGKVINHQTRLITVNFPNGAQRHRNCTRTIIPLDRAHVPTHIPLRRLLFSRTSYMPKSNQFKKEIDRAKNSNREKAIDMLFAIALAIVMFGLYLIIKA